MSIGISENGPYRDRLLSIWSSVAVAQNMKLPIFSVLLLLLLSFFPPSSTEQTVAATAAAAVAVVVFLS